MFLKYHGKGTKIVILRNLLGPGFFVRIPSKSLQKNAGQGSFGFMETSFSFLKTSLTIFENKLFKKLYIITFFQKFC